MKRSKKLNKYQIFYVNFNQFINQNYKHMKKSRLYLITGLVIFMLGLLSKWLIKTTLTFSMIIELGLILIAILLLKKSRRLDNIEHGRPANSVGPRTKKQKAITYVLISFYFIVFISLLIYHFK